MKQLLLQVAHPPESVTEPRRHKGVGILRPDGDTQAGTDVLALTVRTYYMPNDDWQTLCQRSRELREAAGMLSGYAAGRDTAPVLDHATVAKAIGAAIATADHARSVELPEPLASVADYLDDDLDKDSREFVPTAELVEALDVEPTAFGLQMADLGCSSTRGRVTTQDGRVRQVRGYLIADIRAAAERATAVVDAEVIDDDL